MLRLNVFDRSARSIAGTALCAALAISALPACVRSAPDPPAAPSTPLAPLAEINWPEGTTVVDFENVEGIIVLRARLESSNGVDTTALLAFDSGAGYLALDHELAWQFGLTSDRQPDDDIVVLQQAMRRVTIGSLQLDHLRPLITYRGIIVQSVTDRPVAGLLGQRPLTGRAIWIDYAEEQLAIVPVPQNGRKRGRRDSERVQASSEVFADLASPRATPMAFRLEGDGKIVMRGRVSDPAPPDYSDEMTLIVDTGATWSVVSEEALRHRVDHEDEWDTLEGFSAPTLLGEETASVARVPRFQLRADGVDIVKDDVDTAVLGGNLFQLLTQSIGTRIDGVVGYTFLKHYRVGIDYENRVLWLDPQPEDWEGRPYQDSHIGVQVHRRDGEIRIEAVLRDSPAEEIGLKVGDAIVSVDGKGADEFDVISLIRYLEGRPGSQVDLTVQRDGRERNYVAIRRKLL